MSVVAGFGRLGQRLREMRMEGTEKPWEREGEDREENEIHEEEEEEINGGLEVRERRKKDNGAGFVIRENNGGSLKKEEKVEEQSQSSVYFDSEKVEKVEEEEEIKVEEERNVYFDSEKGEWKCRHCNWTYQSIGPSLKSIPKHEEFCEMAAQVQTSSPLQFFFDSPNYKDSNVNGNTNGTDSAQILAAPEETPTPKVILFENGSSSNSKSYSPLLATSNKGTTNNAAVNIKELDLEKVLDEQETHDLYCPNCNSCITRRVILKKRKRIAKDVKTDSRPEKFPNLGQIRTINEDLDGREQTNVLFKCLSCFSFFIPTECGFDIFHLFGGKKESIQIPTTTQTREEIQSIATQSKEEIQSIATQSEEEIQSIATQSKEEIQSIATLETKEENKITVNKKASNPTSEANYNNWFTSLFQPGVNQKKVNQQDKVDGDPLKVVKERQKEIKKSDESQNIAIKQTTESVIEEQKTDAIAFSEVSTPTSASEIKDTETFDSKTNIAKMSGLSYIVTKREDLIEVVNSVNVGTEIQEELKGPVQVTPTVPKETIIDMPKYRPRECFCPGINMNNWDILKPIVYGGLVETITSLSIISSAASTGASTLNIVLLAAANIIGGLLLIIHDLSELKHAQDEADDRNHDELGRYWALLGRKGHFGLHATVAIVSYIFFGLLPPLVYGFSFRKTNNTEYKLIAVAITSLVCIAILSIGKAHVRPRRTYFTTMLYYITIGVSASGLSYVAGMLLKQLIENLGLFDQGSSPMPSPPNLIGGTNLGYNLGHLFRTF